MALSLSLMLGLSQQIKGKKRFSTDIPRMSDFSLTASMASCSIERGKMMKFKSLMAQAAAALTGMQKRKQSYDEAGLDFDPIIHTILFRHRRRINLLIAEASIALNQQIPVGPEVHRWRHSTLQTPEITRHITKALSYEQSVTVSEVEIASNASRESVRKCLKHGVELGLLTQEMDGKREVFKLSELLVDQLQNRGTFKIWDKRLYELSRFVCAMHDIRNVRNETLALEKRSSTLEDPWPTLQEEIFDRHFEEDGKYKVP
jgi:hypothetical protein